MKKYIHLPTFVLSLVAVGIIAGAISYFAELKFWVLFLIVLGVVFVNGIVAEIEDKSPGGFENPRIKDENK